MRTLRNILVSLFAFTLCTFLAIYWLLLRDLPHPTELQNRLPIPTIRIEDRNGRLLYEWVDTETGRQASLPLDQISPHVIDATIATEDRNYWSHPGVDLIGVARAIWSTTDQVSGGQAIGGSTITQQLARNLLLSDTERTQRTLKRKTREAWLAYRLEQTYSKEEILALYLNQSYYGGLAYGIEAAAQTWFGRTASDLTVAQAALLAGLPQAPAFYNPLVNPEAAKARQEVVLGLMLKDGLISAEQVDLAYREPLIYTTTPYPIEAPHFVQMVKAKVDSLFPTDVRVNMPSLTVRTTLDLDWQQKGEKILATQIEKLNQPEDGGYGHNVENGALVAIDPRTGEVLTLVGSPNFFDADSAGAINMAISPRQPGSTLKPLIYAASMNPTRPNPATPATMFLDVTTTFFTQKGESYVPLNFSRTEHGPVLMRQALASSLNIPAVAALNKLGLKEGLTALQNFGLTTYNSPEEFDLSLALGGGSVTLYDLVQAYTPFANQGSRVEPMLILEIRESASGTIVYTPPTAQFHDTLDPRVAWLINDILSDDAARELSFGRNSLLRLDRSAAAKTGTTNNFRDNWTVGYTPELVTGVWIGNVNQSPMVNITGITGAGPIWHQFMRSVLTGRADMPFVRPDGISQVEICTLSGFLPSPDCPYTRLEWFLDGTAPAEPDSFYHQVRIDNRTGMLATSRTPGSQSSRLLVLDLPPAAHHWAHQQNIPLLVDLVVDLELMQAELTLSNDSNSDGSERGPVLAMSSPSANAIYRIAPSLPAEVQKIEMTAITDLDPAELVILLNGQLLQSFTSPPYTTFWQLEVGRYDLVARAVLEDGRVQDSRPVYFEVGLPEGEFVPDED
ncbi:MAG: penicillin-binding protein 1C [Cellvibrionaceae bacterium]|jgi:penicillin-binding protein 1C